MFIFKEKTGSSKKGTDYFTYKLFRSIRKGLAKKPTKETILNLGTGFSFPKEKWTFLTKRIEQILNGVPTLFGASPDVEREARRIVSEIKLKEKNKKATDKNVTSLDGFVAEDMEIIDPRTVGAEYISLHAVKELHLIQIFASLGFSDEQINLFLALIIGRMVKPGSERSTYNWLLKKSALGDLINVDFTQRSEMSLYRAADEIYLRHEEIEKKLYETVLKTVDYDSTIILFDLTNTYFEGSPDDSDAKRGYSKEKRFDCPLVTLALMVDWRGFIIKSKKFPGNVGESTTLDILLEELNPPIGTMFIMDRGISTAENIAKLVEKKYRYLVVNRERERSFDEKLAKPILTASEDEILIYNVMREDGLENKLMCRSPKRAEKEKAMVKKKMEKYEEKLIKLNDSLTKPRAKNDISSVNFALGKLSKEFSGVSHYYKVTVQDDQIVRKPNETIKAIRIDFEKIENKGGKLNFPGVYSLKTNDLSLSPEEIWRTYVRLTRLESVFRCFKSELGLRPIFHQKKKRIDSHLFISIIAYQCVNKIRWLLEDKNIHDSWKTIVNTMETHMRITAHFENDNHHVIEVRKASRPELWHLRIYNALNLSSKAGKTTKKIYN